MLLKKILEAWMRLSRYIVVCLQIGKPFIEDSGKFTITLFDYGSGHLQPLLLIHPKQNDASTNSIAHPNTLRI